MIELVRKYTAKFISKFSSTKTSNSEVNHIDCINLDLLDLNSEVNHIDCINLDLLDLNSEVNQIDCINLDLLDLILLGTKAQKELLGKAFTLVKSQHSLRILQAQ